MSILEATLVVCPWSYSCNDVANKEFELAAFRASIVIGRIDRAWRVVKLCGTARLGIAMQEDKRVSADILLPR